MPHAADRPLRIGVDGRELIGRATGVGRYIREVLRAWTTAADGTFPHTLVVFVPSAPSDDLARDLGPATIWQIVPSGTSGTWWEQWSLPMAVRRAGVDVFFAGAYTAPRLLPCPFVLAVYDVSYFAHPDWFSPREGLRRRVLTRLSAGRARTVITISEFSAREIEHWVKVPRVRITLAPPGAPARVSARDEAARTNTVLFVGSLFTRRRIPDLIAGFAQATRSVPDARLVLVGDNRTSPPIDPDAIAREHGVADRVQWLHYVADDELNRLYQSARVFAFLSTYEGFAMTPLEALAHGVPSLLLDTAVAREVYRDAAMFVSPTAESIGAGLTTLLRDEDERARLAAAGDALLNAYVWSRTAATIQTALEDAAST